MRETIYKYVDLNGLEKILTNQTLKFTNPIDFNDPFEFHPKLVDRKISPKHKLEILKKNNKDISQERLNRFKEIIRQESGEPQVHISEIFERQKITSKVTCFSEIDNNLLMWAHYSDKHRGACIGFNTNLLYSDFKFDGFLNNVKYSRKIITKKLSKLREQAISHWICSKGKDWRYEKEVRIILGSNYSEFVQFNICSIEEIIFGAKLTEDDKLNIEKLIYNENKFDWIKTSEMKISEIAYKLEKNNRR